MADRTQTKAVRPLTMDYDYERFITTIQQKAQLSWDEAERAAQATLQTLAERLRKYEGRDDVIVLGLPRGGVPVAFEVARALDAPLDIFLVRKLGVPGHEELALGAIATGGLRVLNKQVVQSLNVPEEWID